MTTRSVLSTSARATSSVVVPMLRITEQPSGIIAAVAAPIVWVEGRIGIPFFAMAQIGFLLMVAVTIVCLGDVAVERRRRRREEDVARADVMLLADHFLQKYAILMNREIHGFKPEALQRIMLYEWPGNVREMAAVMDRAVLIGQGRELDVVAALGQRPRTRPADTPANPASATAIEWGAPARRL